jgi:hypothetical protein
VAAMSNLDPDDPFNFTTQLNTHPEPLGNLNVGFELLNE